MMHHAESYNPWHKSAANNALMLRECSCGAQTFSEKTDCPCCGSGMKPIPPKKPTVARARQ